MRSPNLGLLHHTISNSLSSFRDAPTRQNSELFCAEGAGPESISPASLRHDGFRARSRCLRPGMTISDTRFRSRSTVCSSFPADALQMRGRREDRALGEHPQPHARKKAHELATTGSPDRSGLPCAMVLTGSSALSLVNRAFCHHPRCDAEHRHQVDASVGASGPHGFAVRIDARRLRATLRPPHPALHVRDDRDTPLLDEAGRLESLRLLLPNDEANYFPRRGWTLICVRCALICPSGSLIGKVVRKFSDNKAMAASIRRPDVVVGVQVECARGPSHDFFGSNCALDRIMKASVWLMSSIGT